MTESVPCPDSTTIADFLAGRLSRHQTDAVATHVENCKICQQRCADLDGDEASIDQFVQLQQPLPFADESRCGQLMGQLTPRTERGDGEVSQTSEASGAPPRHVGDYQLLEQLGEGGMGTVYRARHQTTQRIAAVKIVHPKRRADLKTLERFEREMVAIGRLAHRNIVRALDAGRDANQHYLVMEYVDGYDLSQILSATGPMAAGDVAEVGRQAAMGLSYIHRNGRIHRDVKPSNLMLSREGTIKLLDLGLARVEELPSEDVSTAPTDIMADHGDSLTKTHQVMGTLEFMAPEQLVDSRSVNHLADVYALGCTLYKLLTGHGPFSTDRSQDAMTQIRQRLRGSAAPIENLRSDLPAGLCAIVDQMLAKQPEERPQSAAEIARLLDAFSRSADLTQLIAAVPHEIGKGDTKASDVTVGESVLGESELGNVDSASLVVSNAQSERSDHESFDSRSRHNPFTRLLVIAGVLMALAIAAVIFFPKATMPRGRILVQPESVEIAELLKSGRAALVGESSRYPLQPGETLIPAGRYEIAVDDTSPLVFSERSIDLKADQRHVLRVGRFAINLGDKQASSSPGDADEIANSGPLQKDAALIERPPVDLITLIDPDRDIRLDDWSMTDGALRSRADKPSLVMIPYQPPDRYRVEMVVNRLRNKESLRLGLVACGRQFCFLIDGFPHLGSLTGLQRIGTNINQRNTQLHRGLVLQPNRPTKLVATVDSSGDRASVTLSAEGQTLASWRGNIAEIAGTDPYSTPSPGALFLGNWMAELEVSELSLVPLSEGGAPIQFTELDSDDPDGRDRAIAERMIWQGCKIRVATAQGTRTLTELDQLRSVLEPFQITGVDMQASPWIDTQDIAHLKDHPTLEELDLAETALTTTALKELGTLPKLESLSIARSRILELPESFASQFPSLRELNSEGTLIADESLPVLASLDQLNRLNVSRTLVSSDAWSQIPTAASIESIDLSATKTTGLEDFTQDRFPNLRKLTLFKTGVPREAVDRFRARMPDVELLTGDAPIDLIRFIDVSRDADTNYNAASRFSSSARWEKKNGKLLTAKETRLFVPVTLPPEFELRMTARRLKDGEATNFGFSIGNGQHFAVGFDLNTKLGPHTILHGVDGVIHQRSAFKVPTKLFPVGNDQPVSIAVRLTRNGTQVHIQVFGREEKLIDWTGEGARLKMENPWWRGSDVNQLWISQDVGQIEISDLTLDPLQGKIGVPPLPTVLDALDDLPTVRIEATDPSLDDQTLLKRLQDRSVTDLVVKSPLVTDVAMASIRRQKFLRSLTLDRTQITEQGLEALADLPLLKEVNLAFMPQISGEVTKTLAKLPRLEYLKLNQCSVYGPGLERLHDRGIKRLAIGHPKLDGPMLEKYILPFGDLEQLGLAGARITDDDLKLLLPISLKWQLHLGWNPNIKGPGLTYVKQMQPFQQLFLVNTAVDDEGLKFLSGAANIERLYLQETAVGDASIQTLKTMPNLTDVYLQNTNFTADGIHQLRAEMPAVNVVASP
ncbi:protein kinase [Roseiconus nitratireducens]|uniref:Protein kinase n=1 Tax=Roseiconus nitratireducens TaxID=2605748 RepID=A0A5M6D6K0_9BACT|nr:serine/threonine-protein kinase [Roseiconus nitratireducens]KAA5541449.1 protein kinase [Roseiconus nitratireducens]